MKTVAKIIFIFIFAFALMGVMAHASGEAYGAEYVISNTESGYVLSGYLDGEYREFARGSSIAEISDYLNSSSEEEKYVILQDLTLDENLTLDGKFRMGGVAAFNGGASLVLLSGNITLSNIELTFEGGSVRVKEGSVVFEDGRISSDSNAVLLDFSANASFTIVGGVASGGGEKGTIVSKSGNVIVRGGRIENATSASVYSEGSVYLSGSPELVSRDYDIVTDKPVILSYGSDFLECGVGIKYGYSFEEGGIKSVFYKANEAICEKIEVFDKNGKKYKATFFKEHSRIAEENFGAVYLPFSVEFYSGEKLVFSEKALLNEKTEEKIPERRTGYSFIGWYTDRDGLLEYDFEEGVKGNLKLYARYALEKPTFEVSSAVYTYDGKERLFGLASLYHPLEEGGLYTYLWYKNNILITDTGEGVKLKNVSDSGKYKCKIQFTYGTDICTVETPEVEVKILKARVEIPTVEPKYYTSEYLTPDVFSTSLYAVSRMGGTVVGAYPVEIKLADFENYEFVDGTAVASVDFKILQSTNYWIDEPIIWDIYEKDKPTPVATSRFGEVRCLYSASYDGEYSADVPKESGKYYCVFEVLGNENYTPLRSEPLAFTIHKERLTGISIKAMPKKTDYKAFEKFDTDGLILSVTYNSGRTELVYESAVGIKYQTAEEIRFNDSAVTASYLNLSISIPITVRKIDYDLSTFIFEDGEFVYDGEKKTLSPEGKAPIGIDGIPLEYEVFGEGINAGEYEIVLAFSSISSDYNIPVEIKAVMKILPYETAAVFLNTEFTYDGELKSPSAYYLDVYERKIPLTVSGASSLAGRYKATATASDGNYKIICDTAEYVINKADYDLGNVIWSEGNFVYDGTVKEVGLSNLPKGVSVIGYTDSRATKAGSYTAKALLSYDERNYNPPNIPTYKWKIDKADYDVSGFFFSDVEAIYDEKEHYPKLVGKMPVGKDGITLEYSFDRGVSEVKEGKSVVNVNFFTSSENYNTPYQQKAFVVIIPLKMSVKWEACEFVYDGQLHFPAASCDMFDVTVIGGRVNAGRYLANAISLDSNYSILNPTFEYEIKKAENCWTEPIKITASFEGNTPIPSAECISGSVLFKYFSDKDATREIEAPTEKGGYYVMAISDGGANYTEIFSELLYFEIKEILPISMTATLLKDCLVAMRKLTSSDLAVFLQNNDGSESAVDFSLVDIEYKNGSVLSAKDDYFTVSYNGFSERLPIKVSKADYDMSGVLWSEDSFEYDGYEKQIELLNLPLGVTVKEYIGAKGVKVGEYAASAVLNYDSENYNLPILPEGVLKISKALVELPLIFGGVYNGKEQQADISSNDYFEVLHIGGKTAGRYPVFLILKDPDNYRFWNGESEYTLYYDVSPVEITLELSPIIKYPFERYPKPEYKIIKGEVFNADSLSLSFEYTDNGVICTSENENYKVIAELGSIIYSKTLSKRASITLFILFLLLFVFLTLILVFRKWRNQIRRALALAKYRLLPLSTEENEKGAASVIKESTVPLLPSVSEKSEAQLINEEEIENSMTVDVLRADKLITDSLARDLLRKTRIEITTYGNKKRVINVDTICENFSSGESVDVNKLKEVGLVPKDTAYIKVLARGTVNKALKVYANDFSLAAVKMLALGGGEAIKVVTLVKKEGKEDKKSQNT